MEKNEFARMAHEVMDNFNMGFITELDYYRQISDLWEHSEFSENPACMELADNIGKIVGMRDEICDAVLADKKPDPVTKGEIKRLMHECDMITCALVTFMS